MTKKLALFGGKPVLKKPLPVSNNIGTEEIKAVIGVLKTGVLSNYVGRAGDYFLGGDKVKEFEKAFCDKYSVKHAITFNSATTALYAALAALEIGPGDEVIVPPMTMCATATVILMNNAIPVFADIDEDTFCIDPESIKKKITPRTKAIMVVDLFGQPAQLDKIVEIAKEHNIKVIEDNAQSPGAKFKDKYAGAIGDIGVFSYNFHKTVHCGEGGIIVTNDDALAFRAQLVRNHGEIVVDDLNEPNFPILGSNLRLTEIHAAIAIEQLKKQEVLNARRIELADYLSAQLKDFPGLTPAKVRDGCTHVYYSYPIKFDESIVGISRSTFAQAMKSEGFPLGEGCVKPLYLLPIFQTRNTRNKNNCCPFDCKHYTGNIDYSKGLCPIDEKMFEKELLLTGICRYPLMVKHIDLFLKAIRKVYSNIEQLKAYEKSKPEASASVKP